MADQYDIIIIGGGHNGLAAAIALRGAGLTVLVLEARPDCGGCATTQEPLLAGFRHSAHANALIFTDLMPAPITPATLGVRTHHPPAQLGVAFADGRPPVILHRPDLLVQTRKSLATYSRKDAATYAALKTRSARFGSLIARGLYDPPCQAWFVEQAKAVRDAYKDCLDVRLLGDGSARTLIDRLFVSPEVRVLLYHLATETGLALEERGGDIAFLGYSLWIAGRWRVPVGGMGAYVDALHEAATGAGARVAASSPARRIVIEQGRAIGVETASGSIIRAAHAVLAATPILETFDNLLNRAAIAPGEREELRAFGRQAPGSIAGSVFCLDAAPHYKSAAHDPAIDACLKTVIGHDTPESVLAQAADLRAGLLPKPAGVVRVHSLWDSTLAPQGKHVAGIDSAFPAVGCLDRDGWQMVELAFPQALFDLWSGVRADRPAPPLAMASDLSSPFERRMLVRTGADQYRASVAGLYLAGPGIYPGGGIHGATGRNAARVILKDLNPSGHHPDSS